MPHKVCNDNIIKIGLVFDFGLAHLYFINVLTLKLLPYTKRFQTSSMLVFSKYYNKKIKESKGSKKQMEKKTMDVLL
jgi:hypothetical protein